MSRTPLLSIFLLLPVLLLTACASGPKRPVFYPNAHSRSVDRAQMDRDIDACMARAQEAGVSRHQENQVAKKAATGALIGGVTTGAWGIVRGDAGERALAGALAGAAGGGVAGAMASNKLSPTFKRFVERCLKEQGYDVIGWE